VFVGYVFDLVSYCEKRLWGTSDSGLLTGSKKKQREKQKRKKRQRKKKIKETKRKME
jgi:hypothetical protein